ncbi:DUF1801 domain-containing protein [Companilactobacillus allii]|uniref:YdhG-like domain-containing protein n=1 Tax=Companilactobacillus allii TaxID=1847728 RepID=A0A1P8Q120_9LACO|nr:DUF1801 domain-containing protein [Companilactobacillus allii]APX71573.1 hypothetical protein BTM29_02915 [Companilactobacillus allii]USQ68654.1 DUF1801 domain-containing protein [Companilactobacillus allii]
MSPIEEYIKNAPKNQQEMLNSMYYLLKNELCDANEKISYGMPTFYLDENIVHFAGMKNHLGFYPTPGPIAEFSIQLKDYKTSKGAIQFPYDQKLPEDLIKSIITFRKQEILNGKSSD